MYVTSDTMGLGALSVPGGQLMKVHPFPPKSGGLAWVQFENPWVVWQQIDSERQPGWTLLAYSMETRKEVVLAQDHNDPGHMVDPGRAPYPVIHNGAVFWAEPVAGGNRESQLVTQNLSSGAKKVIASGVLSSPVLAGGYVIWAELSANGAYSFNAVPADDASPISSKPALPVPESVTYLAGSPDYFAWSTSSGDVLHVYRFSTHTTTDYQSPADSVHRMQFEVISGDYVVWYTGSRMTIADLTSGAAVDIRGSASASHGYLAVSQPEGQVPRGQVGSSIVSIVRLADLSRLERASCP